MAPTVEYPRIIVTASGTNNASSLTPPFAIDKATVATRIVIRVAYRIHGTLERTVSVTTPPLASELGR